MIGTDDLRARPAILDKPHHAVQADIGKGTDDAVPAADRKNRLIVDREGYVVARIGDVGGEARALPFLSEDPFALKLGNFRR